jgi:moderate conductance mechanosensitive channel
VTGAIAPLTDASRWLPTDVSRWLRSNLLVIVLLVLGAILLTRLAGWLRDKIMAHIDARAIEPDELVRSEAAKHRQVVAQVVTWSALAVIYVVTTVLIVQLLGVSTVGLVAPAALLSAALGFGLQRFVQDIGAGFFITGERQYGFGDVITIATAGVTQPVRSSRSPTCPATGRGPSSTCRSRPPSTSATSPTYSGRSANRPTATTGCAK